MHVPEPGKVIKVSVGTRDNAPGRKDERSSPADPGVVLALTSKSAAIKTKEVGPVISPESTTPRTTQVSGEKEGWHARTSAIGPDGGTVETPDSQEASQSRLVNLLALSN